MSNEVTDPTATQQIGTDTPMEEQIEKGKGKAPADAQMADDDDDEDESEEDEEVNLTCSTKINVFLHLTTANVYTRSATVRAPPSPHIHRANTDKYIM